MHTCMKKKTLQGVECALLRWFPPITSTDASPSAMQTIYDLHYVDVNLRLFLPDVNFRNADLTAAVLRCVFTGLFVFKSVRLELKRCMLGPRGAEMLGSYLCGAPHSVSFILDGNRLPLDVVASLVGQCQNWSGVRAMHLSLRRTGLNNTKLSMLLDRLRFAKGLQTLHVEAGDNEPHVTADIIGPFTAPSEDSKDWTIML